MEKGERIIRKFYYSYMYIIRTLSAPHCLTLSNRFKGDLCKLVHSLIYLFLICRQLGVSTAQGTHIRLAAKRQQVMEWKEL